MDDSTVTSKGQVTIPKAVRERLGVKAGDRVTFTVLPDGVVLMRAKIGSIADLAGVLYDPGRESVPIDKLSLLAMLGLDTNVLIRYLMRDDEPAYQAATKLIEAKLAAGRRLMVSTSVFLECEWVLRSAYRLQKDDIASLFDALLGRNDLVFPDEAVIEVALHAWRNSTADFADCLIVADYLSDGCSAVATCDQKASKLRGAFLVQTGVAAISFFH